MNIVLLFVIDDHDVMAFLTHSLHEEGEQVGAVSYILFVVQFWKLTFVLVSLILQKKRKDIKLSMTNTSTHSSFILALGDKFSHKYCLCFIVFM